jgi:hypothetical protein
MAMRGPRSQTAEGVLKAPPSIPVGSFVEDGWRGEVATWLSIPDLAGEVARLTDPAAAVETVHWGRNYLYAAVLSTRAGDLGVVVKQFRPDGRRDRARRSWRAAWELVRCGIPTADPLLLIEPEQGNRPSFFVTRRLEGAAEVRHFFRRLNHEPDAGPFPEVDPLLLLERLGRLARTLHDAGIWYRDLSMGNVLARRDRDGDLRLFLVDCNRVRSGRRLGVIRRCRDTCRFPILERDHREAFLRGYWGRVPPAWAFRRWFWVASIRGYLLKHAVKNRLRRLSLRRRHSHGGRAHPHIPPAAGDGTARDKAVWDPLSDQPHQHAGRRDKLLIRLADAPQHLRDVATVAAAAPGVWRRYRALKSELYRNPHVFSGIGLALRPWPEDPEAHLAAVAELGVQSVLLRLHPWDDDHRAEESLAAGLAGRGLDVAFAIPQNRDLVRDRERWRAAVEEIAERFVPYGTSFQIGQAPNRSKWGVWTPREYLSVFADAADILRRRPGVELVGPAVIDFEFHHTLALVSRAAPGVAFDALSALLYVDRRGAPENRQLGFDTVDKAVLLRAVAETSLTSTARCWITEVNWPLWEGPHSPAGKAAAVDEERQADYLTRYYLLTLGTGLVERVYWWRLLARGYGLMVADGRGGLRRRPAFRALATLRQVLEGATFVGPVPVEGDGRMYHFQLGSDELVVGWSVAAPTPAKLPRPARRVLTRDGDELPAPTGTGVVLTPSPVYYLLAE